MKTKFKSWDQLQEEGFKYDYPKCYKGLKKSSDAEIPEHWRRTLCGKDAEIIAVDRYDRGSVTAVVDGRFLEVPTWMFVDSFDLMAINSPETKSLKTRKGNAIHTKGLGFSFPCDWSDLNEKQARIVAKWILKATRK